MGRGEFARRNKQSGGRNCECSCTCPAGPQQVITGTSLGSSDGARIDAVLLKVLRRRGAMADDVHVLGDQAFSACNARYAGPAPLSVDTFAQLCWVHNA